MKKAASLTSSQDVVRVDSAQVSCDGRGPDDALGHPLIYLNMGEGGHVTCPYCSRQFVLVEQWSLKDKS